MSQWAGKTVQLPVGEERPKLPPNVRLVLQWTRDLPTEPGWYAYANDDSDWWGCIVVEPSWNSPSLLRDHGIKEGDLIVDTGESIKSIATFADWWLKIELPPVPKEARG